jgi:membrane-associated protein
MPYRHFATYNAIGVVLWAGGVTWLGYALGTVPFIRSNIEVLLVLIVLVSVSPMLIEALRRRRRARRAAAEAASDDATATAIDA